LVNHDLLAHRRIEHDVIDRPVWPSNVEVFLHERRPVVVDRIDQLVYLSLAHAGCGKATHLVAPRRVQKDAQGVASVAQDMLRPSTHDDALSGGRRFLHQMRDAASMIWRYALPTVTVTTSSRSW
jgi:hypothetical protein